MSRFRLLSFLSLLSVLIVTEALGTPGFVATPDSLSAVRTRKLKQLTEQTLRDLGKKADAERVAKRVLFLYASGADCIIEPREQLITDARCRYAARKSAEKKTAEKFPVLTDATIEAEAAEKFPIYREGDRISVTYVPSPVQKKTVRGTYRGKTGDGNVLLVGSYRIIWRDFTVLKENQDEILKFDPERSTEMREAYIARRRQTYDTARDEFLERTYDEELVRAYQQATEINEKNGYIFYGKDWVALRDAVATISAAERERLLKQRPPKTTDPVKPPDDTTTKPPDDTTTKQPDDTTTKPPDDTTTKPPDDTTTKPPDDTTTKPPDDRAQVKPPAPPPETAEGGGLMPIIIGVIAVLVVAAGAGFAAMKLKQRGSAGTFYDGTEPEGGSFWPLGDDQEGVPHVAYLYGSRDEATNALSMLSFIVPLSGRKKFRSSHPIHFGFAETDEGGVVAFVGGDALCYAMWREAEHYLGNAKGGSKLSREAPTYFGISLPELEDIEGAVELLKEYNGEGSDFCHYWVFRAGDKETATSFLKQVVVKDIGLHVVVETPIGHWGKDSSGTYQE